MNEEIDIILSRYFSGEATEEELCTLDVWLSKSDENEKQFHQMTLLYQYAGETDDLPTIDTKKALGEFKTYMYEKQRNSYSIFHKASKIWRVAALITILLMATFTLYYFIQPSKTIQLVAVETQKEYTLFENADVTLFPGTEIVYNKKTNHQIQLKGKATFNIQSERSKKLVIQAGETYIEDIGTIFTVDASAPDKSIFVEVIEGEVWFYTNKNTGVCLKANESAVYDTQTKQFKIIEETQPIDAEIEQVSKETKQVDKETEQVVSELVFQNTSLQEAIDIIKIRFGIDVIIASNELNEVQLNVSFDKNETVEYILDIITATISAQWSKRNDVYMITSKY
jgi:ferric-dicitrate binding protein FerR (iron transport regulator)